MWASFLSDLYPVCVLDILVSLTDRRCPRYSCMSTLICSHLCMSSLAENPVDSRAEAKKTLLNPHSFEICLFLYVFISIFLRMHTLEEIKSTIVSFHSWTTTFVCMVYMNASRWLCQDVTAGIWHHSTSTSLSLCLWPLPSWLCTREAS